MEIDTDTLKAEKKPPMATYANMRKWIREELGLKVSAGNIAMMKDEMGLEKQFSYEDAGMAAEKRQKAAEKAVSDEYADYPEEVEKAPEKAPERPVEAKKKPRKKHDASEFDDLYERYKREKQAEKDGGDYGG